MGAWGPGLYSDDFAADLKGTVATVCRLPLTGPEILDLLTDLESAAERPADANHTTFWLVVADQMHRRGIASRAIERAVRIIDDGSNVAALRELGMSEDDLRTRSRQLRKLRERLTRPVPDKQRRTLKSPRPLHVEPGEIYTFPVDTHGSPYNPYFAQGEDARWTAAGWGSCLVIRTGHALDYLSWVQIAPSRKPGPARPDLSGAAAQIKAQRNGVGTLSREHMRRMGMELLGRVEPPDVEPPRQREILSVVTSDISVVKTLSLGLPEGAVTQDSRRSGRWWPRRRRGAS